MRAAFGYLAILLLAYLMSERRGAIIWRTVLGGVLLQIVLAFLLLHSAAARAMIATANGAMEALQTATDAGTHFVFGYLGGGELPFAETHPGASFVLAFKILPLVLVISALSSVLMYWRVLPLITRLFALVLKRTLGLGGAVSVGAAAHVFLGMIEGPLLIRPYLERLSRGELFALMSCGMAGVAGTVMALYASILSPVVPDALGLILVASVISTPAALAVGALMVPFAAGEDQVVIDDTHRARGTMDAIARGTADGIGPLVGIVTSLLVMVALVALVNGVLAHLPHQGAAMTLQGLFAIPLRPLMWMIGIDWAESAAAAQLMGTKTVLNELVAYLDLAAAPAGTLSPHARRILTFAMCGFANFGSLGIMIGGLGAMVPSRRDQIVALGLRSIISGTLATCMSGALAGLLAGG